MIADRLMIVNVFSKNKRGSLWTLGDAVFCPFYLFESSFHFGNDDLKKENDKKEQEYKDNKKKP